MSSTGAVSSQFAQTAYTPLPTPAGQKDATPDSTQPTSGTQQSAAIQQAATTAAPTASQTTTTNPVLLSAHNADGTIGPHHKHVHKHSLLSPSSGTSDAITSVNIHA